MTNSQTDRVVSENQESQYSLSEIFYIVKKYKKTIFTSIALILFFDVYWTFVKKPLYKSKSVIIVNNDQKSISMLDMSLYASSSSSHIENEIQILKSRNTANLVITRLLNSKHRNDLYLFNSKKYIPSNSRYLLTFGLLDQYQEIESLDVVNQGMKEKFINKLLSSIEIKNERNTDILTVSIISEDPNEAKLLVDTLIEVYQDIDLKWITGEMSHLKSFLIERLSDKEEELHKIEEKLKEFQEKEKIFGLDENSSLLLNNLIQYETEYNNILAAIEIINEKEKFINEQLTKEEKILINRVSNNINERLLALKEEIGQIEVELISTISQYDEEHAFVVDLRNKLQKLKIRLQNETKSLISAGVTVADPIMYRQSLMDSVIKIRTTRANLESKSFAFKKLVNEYNEKLSKLPEKLIIFSRLERIRTIHAETYSFMRSKLEEARIGEASKLGKIRVIDKGMNDSRPISPRKIQNLLYGLIFSIIVSLGIVAVIEIFDNTIKSVEQIERRGLSILAIIPTIGNKSQSHKTKKYIKHNKNFEKLQRRIITQEDPKSPISEAYRGLRTSLMYSENKNKSNVMLVSSAGPGEGKTTSIANLAITYANLGKKTILIDGDLRKSVIHKIFKFDKTPGLTSLLKKESSLKDVIKKTEIENLDVISSGIIPPNPSELLGSNTMVEILNDLKKKYDIILFDSPPLLAVTDAYILLKHVNQFVLVVRVGITERGGLNRVINVINQNHSHIITGVIMNAFSQEHSYGSDYYYNYYQYYYGDST